MADRDADVAETGGLDLAEVVGRVCAMSCRRSALDAQKVAQCCCSAALALPWPYLQSVYSSMILASPPATES